MIALETPIRRNAGTFVRREPMQRHEERRECRCRGRELAALVHQPKLEHKLGERSDYRMRTNKAILQKCQLQYIKKSNRVSHPRGCDVSTLK